MNRAKLMILVACILLFCAGCTGEVLVSADSHVTAPPQSLTSSTGVTPKNNFDALLESFAQNALVKDSENGTPENIELIEKWVKDYERGAAGSVAIYYDRGGFPSSLFVLESDGTPAYTMTRYDQDSSEKTIRVSSLAVERTLDFVLGADTDLPLPLIVHKQTILEESIDWSPSADLGITSAAAEGIAEANFIDILKYQSAGKKISGGGIYIWKDAMQEIETEDFPKLYYRTTGAVKLAGQSCYIVSAYSDLEEMKEGVPSGNVLAVSADGDLCFLANSASGGWIFVKDGNEKVIAPAKQ